MMCFFAIIMLTNTVVTIFPEHIDECLHGILLNSFITQIFLSYQVIPILVLLQDLMVG